jgi:hypothetical protein
MKRLAYLLLLLVISAQVDEAWVVAPVSPSVPLADDDDEYLPAQRRVGGEQYASGQGPTNIGLKPQAAESSVVRRGVPSEWDLTTPFTPPPLYLFMSLQI